MTGMKKVILEKILAHYPQVPGFLEFNDPFQLLIAVILSAQCTDAMVNKVGKKLFSLFPSPLALANAPLDLLEELVHSTGFYRAKAKNIKRCAQDIVEKHSSQVPKRMEELTGLAGVGRKTANVILGQVYGEPAIIVDTHFGRVVARLGFTKEKTPEKIEKDLGKKIPLKQQYHFSMAANLHGRVLCASRKPKCMQCFLQDLCPTWGKGQFR